MSAGALLITGVSGFLGGKLAALRPNDFELHGVCHRHPVAIDGCRIHNLDLTGPGLEPLLTRLRPEVIIHTAAVSRPAAVQAQPAESQPLNLEVTRRLAQWCAAGRGRLIFTSSDQVYAGDKSDWTEANATQPVNAYGEQKLAAEGLVRDLLPERGLVLRISLLLGPPAYGGTSFSEWIRTRLLAGQPVPLYYNQIRSALGGDTTARGILAAARLGLSGLFNAGGAHAVSRWEIGQTLAAVTGLSYSYLQRKCFSPTEAEGGPAPLDISMNSDRFWQTVDVRRGTLTEELSREYRDE